MNNDQYEFWLTDDAGIRIVLLSNISHASLSHSTQGYSTIELGLPYQDYIKAVAQVFQRDWRVDVWRSPAYGIPKRREGSYFLRKFEIYDRDTDSMRMIRFYGRGPWDILRRWSVVTPTESYYKKTDYVDDMMKDIVRESFVTTPRVAPSGEFAVDGDTSLGPSVTHTFRGKTVLDVLKELKDISLSYNRTSSAYRKIYFDVVEGPGPTNGFGYIFRTYADRRGVDRTKQLIFSPENGNLKAPSYSEDYLDEITEAQAGETVVDSPFINYSRWNKILKFSGTTTAAATDTASANKMLGDGAGKISLNAQFLSTPGGPDQPRSLYGVDWDFGDTVRVQYGGRVFNADVNIVYLSVNEDGTENIMGANTVGSV